MNFTNELSALAKKYLQGLRCDKNFNCADGQLIEQYLTRQNIPVFAPVIAFQQRYSGFTFTIHKSPTSTFDATLFSLEGMRTGQATEPVVIDNKYYFSCGDHHTAQFWFLLSEDGTFCTYDQLHEKANPLYSSFEKFIESYAYKNALLKAGQQEYPGYYKLQGAALPASILENSTPYIPATDQYNNWLSYEQVMIETGRFMDSQTQYVHIYGKNKAACMNIVEELKSLSAIA